MNLEQQTRALFDLVEADRAAKIAAILDDANGRAAAVRAQAHAEARARMRQAFAEQRQQRRERIAAAQARLATQRRLHEQQRTAALLQLAWLQLPGELARLWREPSARARWVGSVLGAAAARLQPGPWRIVHAGDWPVQERQSIARTLQAQLNATPVFAADAGIAAGLKIVADGNVIDGTQAGLLADRSDFEARLLRLLETAP
jgi:hypothetical protein